MKTLLLFVALLFPATIAAQNDEATRSEINKIKKSSKYIYAECTAPLESEARSMAESALYENINKWVATQKKLRTGTSIVVNNKKDIWSTLAMPRGNNMQRVFIYVKKSDIMTGDNATIIANENLATVEEIEQIQVPSIVSAIGKCRTFKEAETALSEAKSTGKVSDYNRFAAVGNADIYYLFIYDRSFNAKAVLSPVDDEGKRTNMLTGQPDGTQNYRGCGAICFLPVE